MTEFSVLEGLTLARVVENADKDEIYFETTCGRTFRQIHFQDCCECVGIEDIVGDLDDLIGVPIVRAEEREQRDVTARESGTWTFYEIATIKGSVTIRWYGESNGYYSESVDFEETT